MIYQIATRSGRPPSKIESEWSVEELLNAEALARLEGWGQEKRRTAMIVAETHNAVRSAVWARNGNPQAPHPRPLTESHFLPRRVKKVDPETVTEKNSGKLYSVLNSLCGY